MRLWRLTRFPPLDGAGGVYAAGRWHWRGLPILYTATEPTGALAEVLVHLEVGPDLVPDDYRLIGIEVSETLIHAAFVPSLPANWRTDLAATRTVGSTWLRGGQSLLCRVPSAIIQATSNFLLNPLHEDFRQIAAVFDEPFTFDPRLFS
ncbi:MAG: RES family NAD+ phosphorylase [Rhodanobacteraceae bacterium]